MTAAHSYDPDEPTAVLAPALEAALRQSGYRIVPES